MKHHEVFYKFRCWSGRCDPIFRVNFLGAKLRREYLYSFNPERTVQRDSKEQVIDTDYPTFQEMYFEWIDVLESVTESRDKFTMIELGAGHGEWLVNTALAIHSFHGGNFPCQLIGVEAEPIRFNWMKQHFRDNGIDPAEHQLIKAAISDKDGKVWFYVGFPEWYGNAIVNIPSTSNPARLFSRWIRNKIRIKEINLTDFWTGKKAIGRVRVKRVKAVSLTTLLQPTKRVDLIHLDIQGKELDILKSAREEIDKKVKKVHIETHGSEIETGLRTLFRDLVWECRRDYPGQSECSTPYGKIKFQDGIQTWANPKL